MHGALRSAGGLRRQLRATLAQGGKTKRTYTCEADRGPRFILAANWRLANVKSLAAMFQENKSNATSMGIVRTWYHDMHVYERTEINSTGTIRVAVLDLH